MTQLKTVGKDILDWSTSDLTDEGGFYPFTYLTKIRDKIVMLDERRQLKEIGKWLKPILHRSLKVAS